ncbi:MAG: glutamate-5-semialdehyde dehydrogenase [Bacteroidales bacterium]|nr:glutamate-5-semialdehyde dehydrogenase [Bacteroidales bacterium]MDD7124122.1 glutamate-5-semialdehyde dehydrogenase [Bacteroidales bacterium]MDY3743315.1 glutamate-5-semialdehyde dehydrogenase [Prevotella sp.]MDY5448327.1 glutamate-5-semialdehyde dehydrogenase [Prevotella sp.]
MTDIFRKTKDASLYLAQLSDADKSAVLHAVADAIKHDTDTLLEANAADLSRMEKSNPLYDRLLLTPSRLDNIASDMRHVACLPSPLGHITCERTLDNGLHLRRVSVPFGVIGVIYEARPNVTFDVFALCLKSGNACILKGGKDADDSNKAAVRLIKDVLEKHGISPDIINLMPATHEATHEMLNAVGYVDLCIPRGGKRLIEFVRDNARIPVIETGAGVVHAYFDKYGDLEMGKAIVNNAKTRRVSVCNALDCLLIHKDRLPDLKALCQPMAGRVTIYADKRAAEMLDDAILCADDDKDVYGREWMDYKMSVKTVDTIEDALSHIRRYSSGHSECIITDDEASAELFRQHVDAACVYVNAPTSFTDGAQFGLGAEIGISTQKLGPRGPMGLNEMTTYKWLIDGHGQTRQ